MQLNAEPERGSAGMKTTWTLLRYVIGAVLPIVLGVGTASAGMDIAVVNQGTRQIDGLYLSATTQSDWGPDLLNGARLAPNGTSTIHGVGCTQPFVLVAEDLAGCFLYQSMPCGAGTTWTITNDTPRDCGR
jgi:hypothetical protein